MYLPSLEKHNDDIEEKFKNSELHFGSYTLVLVLATPPCQSIDISKLHSTLTLPRLLVMQVVKIEDRSTYKSNSFR